MRRLWYVLLSPPRLQAQNGILQTLKYMKPPEALLTQVNVYTEEKFEDEEDLRERTRSRFRRRERSQSESELTLESLITIAKQHKEIYPMMIDTLKWYTVILEKDLPL